MTLEQLVDFIKNDPEISENIAFWQEIPPKEADYSEFPENLNPRIIEALIQKNINALYSHQRKAFEKIEEGRHIVLVTPTASGKTLAYNLPVLNKILLEEDSRAIYLFPTKALSQDQFKELHDLITLMKSDIRTYTFDGDTPVTARKAIRRAGHIVITNPNMLHQGILPHHTIWVKLFENLKYVVIDEIHHYRGVFGSHLGNLIRRLKRIAAFYGSKPQFICCSATIANPSELAEKIIEEPVFLIDQSGAPSGRKHFLLYNPPLVNKELGIRRSAVTEVRKLASHLLSAGVQFIVFARSRIRVEIITRYIKDAAKNQHIDTKKISGYRGGYLPLERRRIEQGLKNGEILGVVSTNALELGIDIGKLDVSILAGYPGTIASAWQQAGRAGRRTHTSLTILIATSSPLNQYIMDHPEYFFEKSPESGIVDPNNLLILMSHMKCAAFEIPFRDHEIFGIQDSKEILDYLVDKNVLRHTDGKYYWMSEIFPAEEISLRSASPDNVVIIDTTRGERVIGEVDLFSAQMLVHQDAIYMHETNQFHVDRLDWERKKAYVRSVSVDYFTDAITKTNIKVLSVDEEKNLQKITLAYGDVNVATVTTGYKKIKLFSHENVGAGRLHLPEIEMSTSAFWLEFLPDFIEVLGIQPAFLGGVLQGAANVFRNIAPLFVMCDPGDIRAVPMVKAPFSQRPTIYLYDNFPGGVGLSLKIMNYPYPIVEGALNLVENCPCESGCPSCVGPVLEVGEKSKHLVKFFLRALNDQINRKISIS
ncbi:MAG: DEAD/DEAH box helicase [Calditrichaeota bacterium]|nr:DEAD/DEAH box helicase [Calditrichota bacterium]RQW00539.1 MAG: DEAD/DEAH box helicase [Calditrichota bacterium]